EELRLVHELGVLFDEVIREGGGGLRERRLPADVERPGDEQPAERDQRGAELRERRVDEHRAASEEGDDETGREHLAQVPPGDGLPEGTPLSLHRGEIDGRVRVWFL